MLTELQENALEKAKELLRDAGLAVNILPAESSQGEGRRVLGAQSSSLPVQYFAPYHPPQARVLSDEEIRRGVNRLTRKTTFCAFIEHPKGAILEYPETLANPGEAVAHRIPFTDLATKDFKSSSQKWSVEPKGNIQYSLGGKHGGYKTKCAIGAPDELATVDCYVVSLSCRSLKLCDFCEEDIPSHHFVSRTEHCNSRCSLTADELSHSAEREVFERTLAFYCAVTSVGCSFADETWILCPANDSDSTAFESQISQHQVADNDNITHDGNVLDVLGDKLCTGRIIFDDSYMGRAVVRCEHASGKNRTHLALRNLDGFNLGYLSALLSNNSETVALYESAALRRGYGPLMHCTFSASSSQKKQYCVEWHRLGGELVRGELHRDVQCDSHFYFYYAVSAKDRERFPFFLLVCQNPHSHPPPPPVTTPRGILHPFTAILRSLSWRLADATPRRLLLDHGFMSSLRSILGWTREQDPFLSDLHPSLANHSHVNRIILELREELFPHGTGLESLIAMQVDHQKLPVAGRYVRFAGIVDLGNGTLMQMVICMTSDMSVCLLSTRRATIDTSFQRLHGLNEFEIEFWDNLSQKSVVAARVFTSSESADAHFSILKRVFAIAKEDSGLEFRVHYMHGEGLELITADGHRGQALGIGKFLRFSASGNNRACTSLPGRTWEELTEWEHVKHIYRYCEVHFKRNILKLRGKISRHVEHAMLRLCSARVIDDYDATIEIIKSGGPMAMAWWEEKQTFSLAAIYRPASFIPLEIWSAGPATTNGNEQSHRNIYRDGVQLTALAGAMRGYEYDRRAMEARNLAKSDGIFSRDVVSTQEYRQSRSIHRAVNAKRRRIDDADRKVEELNKKVADADAAVLKADNAIQRASLAGKDASKHYTQRAKWLEKGSRFYDEARNLAETGSGVIKARRPNQLPGSSRLPPPPQTTTMSSLADTNPSPSPTAWGYLHAAVDSGTASPTSFQVQNQVEIYRGALHAAQMPVANGHLLQVPPQYRNSTPSTGIHHPLPPPDFVVPPMTSSSYMTTPGVQLGFNGEYEYNYNDVYYGTSFQ